MEEKALQIITQVGRLYHRYGIKSVTMDDIAKQLGISKKTLYEHFTDKEDIVRRVLMMELLKGDEEFRKIESDKLNAIEELFEVYKRIKCVFRDYNASMEYDIRKYYPDLFMKIRDSRRKRMLEASYNNMTKGKKEGLYRSDLNARILSRLHTLRIENLFENDLFSIEELVSFKVFHELFVYHLNGIMSDRGREFFKANFEKFRDPGR
jgi:TetR/AcrR family transcriptional regulator, cholesterol catabolism regulator